MDPNDLEDDDLSLEGGRRQLNTVTRSQRALFAPPQSQHPGQQLQADQQTQQQQQNGDQQHVGQRQDVQQYQAPLQQQYPVLALQTQDDQLGGTQKQYRTSGQPSETTQRAAAVQEDQLQSFSQRHPYPSAEQQQEDTGRQVSSNSAQSTVQQTTAGASSQFLQVPGANRVPSGGSANSHASGPSSNVSFVQQILPRRRPLGGQSQMTRPQQSPPNNQQAILAHSEYRASQSQRSASAAQATSQLHLASGSSQQSAFTTTGLQPAQQHSSSGKSVVGSQRVQDARQLSTGTQIFHPTAPNAQSGAQQHFTNEPQSTGSSQIQIGQQITPSQASRGVSTLNEAAQNVQQASQSTQPPLGSQANAATQRFGVNRRPMSGMCQFVNDLDSDGDDHMDDADGVEEDEDDVRQRALGRTEQWLNQTHGESAYVGNVQTPQGLSKDSLYPETLRQVQDWQGQQKFPMTEDQQARLNAQEAWRKKDSIKGGKRLAEMDDSDIGADEIEEAARNAKKQRTQEPGKLWQNAHKVYAQGPGNRTEPEPMDEDDEDETSDDEDWDGAALDAEILGLSAKFVGKRSGLTLDLADARKKLYEHEIFDPSFSLLNSICCDWEFMIEVTKHLRVKDLIMLYSTSRTFHDLVNLRFQSTIAAWAQEMSPAGYNIFYYKFYSDLCVKDPAGKAWENPGPVDIPRPPWAPPQRAISRAFVRAVPGFRYLAMIAQRETRTRDILACLARSGHRLPESMHVTLKKMWQLMDAPTNRLRRSFIQNTDMWTDRDLCNAQMFYVKLQMRFNEPLFGCGSSVLADTFLGLRDGLDFLWKMLRHKDFLEPQDAIHMRLRYYCSDSIVQHYLMVGEAYYGVHPSELINEHLEGWGAGKLHLSRPDELVIEESIRRGGGMEKHIIFMMFWGHVDWKKRLNLVPTEEEMYMSDEDLPPLPKTGPYMPGAMWGKCGNVPFDADNWQPKHAMKARWKKLLRAEKLAVIKHDRQEQEMAMPYDGEDEEFWDLPYNANDTPHPDYSDGEPPREEVGSEDADGDARMGGAGFEDANDGGDDSSEELNVRVEYEYIYDDDESLPMPATVTDTETIANWDEMDPYLQQVVIDEQARLHKQDEKDERTMAIEHKKEQERLKRVRKQNKAMSGLSFAGPSSGAGPGSSNASPYTSPMKKKPKRYTYPGITEPVSLALLAKYDRFAPDEFRTNANGKVLRGDPNAPVVESSSSDYENFDDDDLKGLADYDYDTEECDFDVDVYEKFLERAGDDGGFRRPHGEEGAGKGKGREQEDVERVVEGNEKALAVESSDEEYDYYDTMAHEEDLDDDGDDIPLPAYEFRTF